MIDRTAALARIAKLRKFIPFARLERYPFARVMDCSDDQLLVWMWERP